MFCSSASTETPMASASLARGLSSAVKSNVSPGSMSLRRKLSSVTRKGLANLRAFLIKPFISLLFTCFPYPFRRRLTLYRSPVTFQLSLFLHRHNPLGRVVRARTLRTNRAPDLQIARLERSVDRRRRLHSQALDNPNNQAEHQQPRLERAVRRNRSASRIEGPPNAGLSGHADYHDLLQ